MVDGRMGGALLGAALAIAGCSSESRPRTASKGLDCGDLPVTYEAEGARLEGDAAIVELEEGDSGFVVIPPRQGNSVAFDVCVPHAGYYTLDLSYGGVGNGPVSRTIYIDGREFPGPLTFERAHDPDAFTSREEAVPLEEGTHEIVIAFGLVDAGTVSLDSLTVRPGVVPSDTSVTSLLLNNWEDLVGIHHSARLHPADADLFGPALRGLHFSEDWATNQLDWATAFFRLGDRDLTDIGRFRTELTLDREGRMQVAYERYDGESLPVEITKHYVMPPEEPFLLARYTVVNRTDDFLRFSLLEALDPNNLSMGNPFGGNEASEGADSSSGASSGSSGGGSGSGGGGGGGAGGSGTPKPISAEWDGALNAWIVDLEETNGTFLVLGAFSEMDGHFAGETTDDPDDELPELVRRFGAGEAILPSDGFSGEDLLVALRRDLELGPGRSVQVMFFYAVGASREAAIASATRARSQQSPTFWFEQTRLAWDRWLARARMPELSEGMREAYEIALVSAMMSRNPEFGTFVAATNPAYSYKVWPRDASVVAMGLDAAGYREEAGAYFRWMAQAQQRDDVATEDLPTGTWYTNYSFWEERGSIDFVQPEHDAVGLFLVGTYHHWRLLAEEDEEAASAFLDDVWGAVTNSTQWLTERVEDDEIGWGPAEFSIWEEQIQFATFTQATYAAGLIGAQRMAEARGEAQPEWIEDARTIRDAIERVASAEPCAGGFNLDGGSYYARGAFMELDDDGNLVGCTPDERVDASVDILWVLGLLDPAEPRSLSHRDMILRVLGQTEFGYGISRYEGDTYYYTSSFNPGGLYESRVPEPTWPQMSMYMAMAEHWLGDDDTALRRLEWYATVTARGFMPPGEAIDWSTQQPIISTAVEPVTGMWYALALLTWADLYDPRLPALEP